MSNFAKLKTDFVLFLFVGREGAGRRIFTSSAFAWKPFMYIHNKSLFNVMHKPRFFNRIFSLIKNLII